MGFVVIVNQKGYLPESDPVEAETFDDMIDRVLDELDGFVGIATQDQYAALGESITWVQDEWSKEGWGERGEAFVIPVPVNNYVIEVRKVG